MRRGSSTIADAHRFERLPGWELVSAGLADLAAGRATVAAMLVASASVRFGGLGVTVPPTSVADPQARLYELLVDEVGEGQAHGRYNALRRRLLSFLRSADTHASAD